jgi:hypothetical protein
MIGQRFGKLVVLELLGTNRYRSKVWLCQCDCGKQRRALERDLLGKSGRAQAKDCGCESRLRRNDLKGQRFGFLVVQEFSHIHNRQAYWKCLCDCGSETIVVGNSLRSSHTTSCGCRGL